MPKAEERHKGSKTLRKAKGNARQKAKVKRQCKAKGRSEKAKKKSRSGHEFDCRLIQRIGVSQTGVWETGVLYSDGAFFGVHLLRQC